MDIKPRFNTNTIRIQMPITTKAFKSKISKDPNGIIPNGIFKVVKWEKILQMINIIIFGALLALMIILITLYSTIFQANSINFIIPILITLGSFWKLTLTILEKNRFKKELEKYTEDLKIGLTSQPPFITRIYRDTHIKQIKHNWITFFILSNGSLVTFLLWKLKDSSWWIFNFKKWISSLVWNPSLLTIILAISLLSIAVIHIYFAIQRKRKIIEIDSYFGDVVVPVSEIEQLKTRLNKSYRRLFVIYIMILLIIPLIIKFVLKLLRKK